MLNCKITLNLRVDLRLKLYCPASLANLSNPSCVQEPGPQCVRLAAGPPQEEAAADHGGRGWRGRAQRAGQEEGDRPHRCTIAWSVVTVTPLVMAGLVRYHCETVMGSMVAASLDTVDTRPGR